MSQYVYIGDDKYNLTTGKTYDSLGQEGSFIYVMNDSNEKCRYNMRRFNLFKKKDSLRDIVSTISLNKGRDISFKANNDSHRIQLRLVGCDISCGIYQLYYVYHIFKELNDVDLSKEDRDKLAIILLKRVITSWHSAFVICSINKDDENFEELSNVLTPNAASYDDELNPNSKNIIRVWVLNTSHWKNL